MCIEIQRLQYTHPPVQTFRQTKRESHLDYPRAVERSKRIRRACKWTANKREIIQSPRNIGLQKERSLSLSLSLPS